MKRYALFAVPALIILSGLLIWSIQESNQANKVEEIPVTAVTPATAPEAQPATNHQEAVTTLEEDNIASSEDLTTTVLKNTEEDIPESVDGFDIGSDESVSTYIANNLNPKLNTWLVKEHVLSKVVRAVNAIEQGKLVSKHRPIEMPSQSFKSEKTAKSLRISPQNYLRYTPYIDLLEELGTDKIVTAYNFHYPAMSEAFAQLGVPSSDFRNVTKQVLETMLATPEIEGDLALSQKSVMFEFKDAELEALPAAQKLLLRMGPENRKRLKKLAKELLVQL